MTGKVKWTPKELNLMIRLIKREVPLQDIADQFSITVRNLKTILYSHKIPFPTRELHPTIVFEGVCERCGMNFTRRISTGMKKPKYCSHTCHIATIKSQEMKDYKCVGCGITFQRLSSTNPKAKPKTWLFCGKSCQSTFESENIAKVTGGKI